MKKLFALLLASLLLLSVLPVAFAEDAPSVYDALVSLVNGRTFTLTVSAEADGELADVIARYGTVTCTLRQDGDRLLLNAACEGEAFLNVTADAEGLAFETNLLENNAQNYTWASLEPSVKLDGGRFEVSMTGPDHELIRFSCSIDGESPDDYYAEIQVGFITGPGNVHSLWDGLSAHEGEAAREFYFSFSEEEYALEGEGAESVERADDGLTITRDEELTVTYNEDELGTVAIHAVLTVTK